MAPDYKSVLAEMSSLLHHLALQQQLPDATSIQNYGDTERIQALAEKFSPEDIQLYYEITVRAQRDLPLIADGRQGLEMALLRMLAFRPESGADVKIITSTQTKKKQPRVKTEARNNVQETETVATKEKPAQQGTSENWDDILAQLNLAGMPKAFASHCTLKNIDAGLVTLQVSSRHESLHNANVEEKISTALSNYFSKAVKLKIEIVENKPESPAERKQREMQEQQLEAEASIASDPFVESLTEAFDASIIPDSVSPTR